MAPALPRHWQPASVGAHRLQREGWQGRGTLAPVLGQKGCRSSDWRNLGDVETPLALTGFFPFLPSHRVWFRRVRAWLYNCCLAGKDGLSNVLLINTPGVLIVYLLLVWSRFVRDLGWAGGSPSLRTGVINDWVRSS